MERKKFQDLDLKDAFLFAAAMSDDEICRMTLEVILGRKISKVKVHAEHMLFFNSDSRSIRLDIYADELQEENGEEGNNSYNVEMQGENQGNLPKRSRYHQAQMDVTFLKPGADFNELNASYVVFICTFDPFGQGLYRYTFENRCKESGIPLEDGTTKIFLNTKGKNADEVPAELIHFLKYVETSTRECAEQTKDSTVERLHKRVETLKKGGEWERRYMTLEEMLRDEKKAGYAEGLEAGRSEGHAIGVSETLLLIQKMTEAGEMDKVSLLSDSAFLQEMYKKYQV